MSSKQYEDVTSDEMMQTVFRLRTGKVKLAVLDMKNLFKDYTESLSAQSSVRTALLTAIYFHQDKGVSEDDLKIFREKMIEVIDHARRLRHPEIARTTPSLPNENAPPMEILPMGKDRTLGGLSILLKPGQERRFAEDNFTPQVLEYLYDKSSRPGDYATGGTLTTILFKGLQKIANQERVSLAVMEQSAHLWKDDGLKTNLSFETYLSKKDIEKRKSRFSA